MFDELVSIGTHLFSHKGVYGTGIRKESEDGQFLDVMKNNSIMWMAGEAGGILMGWMYLSVYLGAWKSVIEGITGRVHSYLCA